MEKMQEKQPIPQLLKILTFLGLLCLSVPLLIGGLWVYVFESSISQEYGVGMTVQQRENQTVVLAPSVDSPSFKAGIRPGDIILKVDGKTCEGLTTTEVADMLKGAKGTTVHISLGREGLDEPIDVALVRDKLLPQGVGHFTQAVTTFHRYFPKFLQGRFDSLYLSAVFSFLAIILSVLSLPLSRKLWKTLNSIILVLGSLMLLWNLFGLM